MMKLQLVVIMITIAQSSIGIDNRFVNVYYCIDLLKIQNIKLICLNTKVNLKIGISYENSLFLRLVDLDIKVLSFNLIKKLKLTNLKQRRSTLCY